MDKLEKETILKLARPKERESALDVGCGTGNYAFWLSRMGLRVTGVDISREMVDVAKKKVGSKEDIQFIVGDADDLPFGNETFDLVLAVVVLEFASDPRCMVEEMFRVIKPEGRIVIGVFNRYSPWVCWRRIRGVFKGSIYNQARFYSLNDLKSLIGINKKLEEVVVPLVSHNMEGYLSRMGLGRRFGGFMVVGVDKA